MKATLNGDANRGVGDRGSEPADMTIPSLRDLRCYQAQTEVLHGLLLLVSVRAAPIFSDCMENVCVSCGMSLVEQLCAD